MLPSSGVGNLILLTGRPSARRCTRLLGSGDLDHPCLSGRTTRGPLGPTKDRGIEALAAELLVIASL